jgi:hypothetical protein
MNQTHHLIIASSHYHCVLTLDTISSTRHSSHPAQIAIPATDTAATDTAATDTAEENIDDLFGGPAQEATKAAEAPPTAPTAPTTPAAKAVVYQGRYVTDISLTEFFQKHAPAKIKTVGSICKRLAGECVCSECAVGVQCVCSVQ